MLVLGSTSNLAEGSVFRGRLRFSVLPRSLDRSIEYHRSAFEHHPVKRDSWFHWSGSVI
jgi:hypothetical protein